MKCCCCCCFCWKNTQTFFLNSEDVVCLWFTVVTKCRTMGTYKVSPKKTPPPLSLSLCLSLSSPSPDTFLASSYRHFLLLPTISLASFSYRHFLSPSPTDTFSRLLPPPDTFSRLLPPPVALGRCYYIFL